MPLFILVKLLTTKRPIVTVFPHYLVVGGGSVFSGNVAAGTSQAIAAGLVPAGLTPVAFFPPLLTQRLPATSVIFLEAIVKKRKKRYSNGPGSMCSMFKILSISTTLSAQSNYLILQLQVIRSMASSGNFLSTTNET